MHIILNAKGVALDDENSFKLLRNHNARFYLSNGLDLII